MDLDGTDDVFNWPVMYAVEVGHWDPPGSQAKQLREYLDRGGFPMVDDFHGTQEWSVFLASLIKVFPDLHIEDIPQQRPDLSHSVRSGGAVSGAGRSSLPPRRHL